MALHHGDRTAGNAPSGILTRSILDPTLRYTPDLKNVSLIYPASVQGVLSDDADPVLGLRATLPAT